MSKIDEAKIEILNNLKAKEYVIEAEFDDTVADMKPRGYIFYRLNILHKNKDGAATFSAKGVYIHSVTGEYYLHTGGVALDSLKSAPVIPNTYTCPAGGVCEYSQNAAGKYYCKKCLKIK
jgi:hypothetical protein